MNFFLKRMRSDTANSKSHLRSKKQEKEIATRIGGRLVPRSGAGDIKGDCRLKGVVRIEAKTTNKKSFSVTLDMIEKIEEAAAMSGELPMIVIEFNHEGKKIKEVAVCPIYVLDTLRQS